MSMIHIAWTKVFVRLEQGNMTSGAECHDSGVERSPVHSTEGSGGFLFHDHPSPGPGAKAIPVDELVFVCHFINTKSQMTHQCDCGKVDLSCDITQNSKKSVINLRLELRTFRDHNRILL